METFFHLNRHTQQDSILKTMVDHVTQSDHLGNRPQCVARLHTLGQCPVQLRGQTAVTRIEPIGVPTRLVLQQQAQAQRFTRLHTLRRMSHQLGAYLGCGDHADGRHLRKAGAQAQADQRKKTKQVGIHKSHVTQAFKMQRMKVFPRYWADCITTDFAELDAAQAVAVLPLGATEQHGPHLPLSVDTDLVNAMLAAALGHLLPADQVLVLPTQSIGLSSEHLAYDGTLSFSPASVIEQWCALGESVARVGVKKLLLFNAHGGNVGLMDVVARELRGHCGLTVFSSNWYQLPLGEALSAFDAHEQRYGVHGGDMETSLMLAIAPHKVRMPEAQHFPSTSEQRAQDFALLGDGKSAKLGWHMQDYNLHGAAGNAAAATAVKGQALLDAVGVKLAKLIQELNRFEPLI